MKAFIFFSVYEGLFHRVALGLQSRGVQQFSGFTWSEQQLGAIQGQGINYAPVQIFTRDLLPRANDGSPPDIAWLEQRERELGISIQRMLAAERHLLKGRTYDQILRLAEVVFRGVAANLDAARPDFVFSEDVSCFCSYAHFVLARERGIPFWCIGDARLPARLSIYSMGFQHSEFVQAKYREITERGLTPAERSSADAYVREFRDRPRRPPGMKERAVAPGVGMADAAAFWTAFKRYRGAPDDPTAISPTRTVRQRLERIARIRLSDAMHVFEKPVAGEKYVIYPIHFQPEASTLVQAPMYLDQAALIQDIARSLPVGHRLYVKEHVSNRGRRPLAFYNSIRSISNVRLLGPDENTWELIQGASAIAVITGTMGWEGLLFGKPVVTFGHVFMNILPHVHRARDVSKDDLYELFRRAIFEHRPDHDALLTLISAIQQTSHPGRIHNPNTFPVVLEPDNIERIIAALTSACLAPESQPT